MYMPSARTASGAKQMFIVFCIASYWGHVNKKTNTLPRMGLELS